MKIYAFFKKPTKDMVDDPTLSLRDKYALYAITPTKEMAKIFEKSRDKNQFLKRTIECDSQDGYDEYLIHHRGKLLNYYWLETYKDKNTKDQKACWVSIPITENELNFVIETAESGSALNAISGWIPIDIFEPEMQEALRILKYDKAMRFALSMTASEMMPTGVISAPDDGDFYDLGFTFDQFGVFLLLYQPTFSPNFFEYMKISDVRPNEGELR